MTKFIREARELSIGELDVVSGGNMLNDSVTSAATAQLVTGIAAGTLTSAGSAFTSSGKRR